MTTSRGWGWGMVHVEKATWRTIDRPELGGLASVISEVIGAEPGMENNIRSLRESPSLLMFSDYGGAHKSARFEVLSYLVTTIAGLAPFNAMRVYLRQTQLAVPRRMSYKSLNDNVRLRSLPAYLSAADRLDGVLISFAVEKRAMHRLTESYTPQVAFGTLGPWATRSFGKLSRVGHLGAIVIEGLRANDQDLIWITDEDEIAPNPAKHVEATEVLAHLLNHYLSGPMGHIRFGTTASDNGDLLIEDLTAVPDLAAGILNEVLTEVGSHPESQTVERLFVPLNSELPVKILHLAKWLGAMSSSLTKVNVVVNEGPSGCAVNRFVVVTDLNDL
jgi:hypothetical protein